MESARRAGARKRCAGTQPSRPSRSSRPGDSVLANAGRGEVGLFLLGKNPVGSDAAHLVDVGGEALLGEALDLDRTKLLGQHLSHDTLGWRSREPVTASRSPTSPAGIGRSTPASSWSADELSDLVRLSTLTAPAVRFLDAAVVSGRNCPGGRWHAGGQAHNPFGHLAHRAMPCLAK